MGGTPQQLADYHQERERQMGADHQADQPEIVIAGSEEIQGGEED